MALPQPKTFRQELPPPGGFPAVKYKKHLVQRGPSSLIIMLGSLGITCGGLWYAMKDNEEREYQNLARFNQRYERAFVLQAKEEVQWQRRHKQLLDEERKLMQHVPGWVVGERQSWVTKPERPSMNHTDPRRISLW